MKQLTTLFLCLASVFHVHAQSLSLFDVDASNFPSMKAKFYAFDATGKQVRPSMPQLTITENGLQRVITSVTCPPPAPPVAISSVLTIDVSGSMSGGSTVTPNIDLAKDAAKAWIQGLPAGLSECALTSFDNSNYLTQDFTTDRSRLLKALSTLTPNSGTDYDMGLLRPLAGSLQVSKRGRFKHVVVFLSDGMPNSEPNSTAIIAEAKRQNCLIFAVTLGMPCPQSLKDIASQTGGQWYENVTTTPEAEDVYRKIMQVALGNAPCEITWTSDIACEARNTTVKLHWLSQKSTVSYQQPLNIIASLKVTPYFIGFGNRLPATQKDTTLTLTAQNADFTVISITRKFGSAEFTVVNTAFPLTIPKNTSKNITLRFAPSDSGLTYASFEITTDKCYATFSSNGGKPSKKPKVSTLKLTAPNGGENFVVGIDTVITWEGISPTDTVSLEYSIDNGVTWKFLTKSASGLKYTWKNVPKPTSTKCLVRVKQGGGGITDSNAVLILTGHTSAVRDVAFSPDGSTIATASQDRTAKIWDANTGALIRTLTDVSGNDGVNGIAYSPDGSRIATTCSDGTHNGVAKIWDAHTGALIMTLTGHAINAYRIAFSPDGNRIATAGWDRLAKVWDANTGAPLLTLTGHSEIVYGIAFSPDGNKIATTSWDNSAKIWDANSGLVIKTLYGHNDRVTGIAFSPDGSRIATSSMDNSAMVWYTDTGYRDPTFIGHIFGVNDVAYSPDGSKIATSSQDRTAKLWDVNSRAVIRTIKGHTGFLNAIDFSPDGRRIATASEDSTAMVWDVDGAPIQMDVSDSVFSIVAPSSASQDIDMRQCLVGKSKDSVITTFVQNTGSYPFRVESIQFTGADSQQFSLVSGIPPFTVPSGSSRAVEFHFAPTSIGVKTAQIVIYTQADTLLQSIRGEGITPTLSVIGDIIDFGRVEVGKLKDTIQVVTIKNTGTVPLSITAIRHAGPNDVDFTTLAGGGNFTVAQGDTAKLDLRFAPKSIGRTSGRLLFEYNGFGSPATVQLFGEGTFNTTDTARTTVIAQDITAQAGEKVNLLLKLQKSSGMQIVGAPTEWYVRIHYNKSILYNVLTDNQCLGTTDSCMLELSGVYDPKSADLIAIPCITTLGNTDHSTIVIDTFLWMNSAILTEVFTQNGTITLKGVCEDGGVRLFIPATTSTSLSTRPNPAQDNLQIHYGLREPLTVTLELLTMTGQVVQTILTNQSQPAGQYTLTSDLSVLGNGVYLLRLRTNKEMLTTRVDVVK